MRIGIDCGHGGLDEKGNYVTAGKRSPHPVDGKWFYEGVNNRKYGIEYAQVLQKFGHEVVFITDPYDYKDIPLSTRVTIANSKDLDLLVSIHSNGANNTNARGYEVFTCEGSGYISNKAADNWIEEMSETFPELRNRGHKKANFAIIKRTTCPAILLELEFHTNDEAVRLLRSWEFRFKTSLVLANAINNI